MDHTAARKRPSSARFHKYLPYLAHQDGYQRFRVTFGAQVSQCSTYIHPYQNGIYGHLILGHGLQICRQNRGEAQTKDAANLGLGTPHNKSQERVAPTHKTKDRENMDSIRTTSPSCKKRRTPERQRKIPGSGATSIRSLGITLLTVAQSKSLVAEVKASESDVVLTLSQN
jgi:hypothetical protein